MYDFSVSKMCYCQDKALNQGLWIVFVNIVFTVTQKSSGFRFAIHAGSLHRIEFPGRILPSLSNFSVI